jgi:hypothetical protein
VLGKYSIKGSDNFAYKDTLRRKSDFERLFFAYIFVILASVRLKSAFVVSDGADKKNYETLC